MPTTQNFKEVDPQRVNTHQGESTIPDTAIDIKNQGAPSNQAGPSQGDVYTGTGGRTLPDAPQSPRGSSALASFVSIPNDQERLSSGAITRVIAVTSRTLDEGYCLNRPGVSSSTREALIALKEIDLTCVMQITLSTANLLQKTKGKTSPQFRLKCAKALAALSLETDTYRQREPEQHERHARLIKAQGLLEEFFVLNDAASSENARTLYPSIIFACRSLGVIFFGTCTDANLSQKSEGGKTGEIVLQEILSYLEDTLDATKNIDWSDKAAVTAIGNFFHESGSKDLLEKSIGMIRDLHEATRPSANAGPSSISVPSFDLHQILAPTSRQVEEEDSREIIKLWDVVSAKDERKANMEASTRAIVAAVVAGVAVTWPTESLSRLLSVDLISRAWYLFPVGAGASAMVNLYGLTDSALSRKVFYAAANALEDDGYPEKAVKKSRESGAPIEFPSRQETEDLARMASWKPGRPTSSANVATKRTNALRKDLRDLHQKSNDLFRKRLELSGVFVGAVVGTIWLAISAEQSCRSVAASASVAASFCGVRYVGLAVPAWAALSTLRDIVQNHRFDLIRDPKMSALLASGYSKAEIMQEFEATRPRYDKALGLKSWWVGRIGQLANGRGPITQSMLNEWTRNVFLLKSKNS
jgi:hypothetical protein